jgi:hypothetical protein
MPFSSVDATGHKMLSRIAGNQTAQTLYLIMAAVSPRKQNEQRLPACGSRDLRFPGSLLIARLANQPGLSPALPHVGIRVLVNGWPWATAMARAPTVSGYRQSHCVSTTFPGETHQDQTSPNPVIQRFTSPGRNYPLFAHITSYSSPGRSLDCAISCSPGDLFHSVHSRNEQSPDHDDFSLRPRIIISCSKLRADISEIFWLGCRSPMTLQCLPVNTIPVCNTPAAGIIFY